MGPTPPRTDATEHLSALLADVAATPFDAPGWQVLERRARTLTTDLAGAGRIAEHLVVGRGEPPVVVARSLAVAARQLARRARTDVAMPPRVAVGTAHRDDGDVSVA